MQSRWAIDCDDGAGEGLAVEVGRRDGVGVAGPPVGDGVAGVGLFAGAGRGDGLAEAGLLVGAGDVDGMGVTGLPVGVGCIDGES